MEIGVVFFSSYQSQYICIFIYLNEGSLCFYGYSCNIYLTGFQIEVKSCDRMMDKWEQVCPAVLPYQDRYVFILCSETESQQTTGSK